MTIDFELAANAVKPPTLAEAAVILAKGAILLPVFLVACPAVVLCRHLAAKARERQP